MALIQTLGLFPTLEFQLSEGSIFGAAVRTMDLSVVAGQASKGLIVLSMAALGLQIQLSHFRQTGLRPLVACILISLTTILLTLGLLILAV